jgi:nucleotide-binding universal stress UspA family protein
MTTLTVPRELLVAFDDLPESSRALVVVVALAKRLDASVSGVVVNSQHADHEADARGMDMRAMRAEVALRRRHVVASGDVVDSLIGAASDYDDAVLCLGSHGRGPLGQAIVGSVTSDVLARSAAPVLVVGPEARPSRLFGCVIVCVDGSEIALRAIAPARAWAHALRTKLRVLHVTWPPHTRPEGSIPAEAEVLEDPAPVEIITRYATDTDAALIVATTHGHTGLATIGSVATGLIRQAPCAVLFLGPHADGDEGRGVRP